MTNGKVFFQPADTAQAYRHLQPGALRVKVEDLQFAQINLLYHHLKPGTPLEIRQFVEDGRLGLGLYFKGTMVGRVGHFIATQMLRNMQKGARYGAVVEQVSRRPFLPPTAIEVTMYRFG